jgi:N-sulfoglucosamine sulfohydrolase
MPSRNVMFSGRYPHNNRVEGFYMIKDPGYPVMADLMKAAGYYTGIRHKVAHSTPYSPYPAWDVVLDTQPDGTQLHQKNPESYYLSAQRGIAEAKKAGKPFCLNLNISDPHKPFYGEDGRLDVNKPSRVFTAAEVPVPGFLPDDPAVRAELALYYSSVRRGDDSLGGILRALRESGEDERTVIFFLSDHGMPLPFAKTQLYFHSTRTPWMVRWPGVTKPGTVDDRHLVSGVDLLPTLLDVVGLPHPAGMDGRSFAPILRGEPQTGRDFIVAEYNENSGGNRHPMRTIITKDYGYLFNPWSNGTRVMATATRGTNTFRRMQVLAKTDPKVAARLDLFEHRVPEELYHYATDPDALSNLIASPAHQAERTRLIGLLDAWMVKTRDPMLEVFRHRDDPAVREAYQKSVEQEAEDRRASESGRAKGKGGKKKAGKG